MLRVDHLCSTPRKLFHLALVPFVCCLSYSNELLRCLYDDPKTRTQRPTLGLLIVNKQDAHHVESVAADGSGESH